MSYARQQAHGDAVVPSLQSTHHLMQPPPQHQMQYYDGAFQNSLPPKPLDFVSDGDRNEANFPNRQGFSNVQGFTNYLPGGAMGFPAMPAYEHQQVPDLHADAGNTAAARAAAARAARRALTSSQHAELDMARKRANKAAAGRKANSQSARRGKRKDDDSGEDDLEDGSEVPEDHDGEDIPEGTGDEEAKRLKRLLRNRQSAQQARERKKSYVQDLVAKTKGLEQQLAAAEQRIKTLEREAIMLRQVLKTVTGSAPDLT